MNTRRAMERLALRRERLNGLQAIYRETGETGQALEVLVTRGRSLLKLSDPSGGVKMVMMDHDFFIRRERLVLGNPPVIVEPKQGAFLDVTEEDGVTRRYQVHPPSPMEPSYRLIDSSTTYRLHTKFIKIVSPVT